MAVNVRTVRGRTLLDVEQFDVEDQSGVRRDDSGVAAGAVREIRRTRQLGSLSYGHLESDLNVEYASGSWI